MDLATTNAYALPGNLTANIQHGSWTSPIEPGKAPKASLLNSNQRAVYEDLKYSKKDIEHVEEWVKRHVETTWHSLGVSTPIYQYQINTNQYDRHAPWHPARVTVSSDMVF